VLRYFRFFWDQLSLHNSPRKTFTGVISEAKEGKFQRSTLPPDLPNWPGRQYTNLFCISQVSLLVPADAPRFTTEGWEFPSAGQFQRSAGEHKSPCKAREFKELAERENGWG
jgi:hypothetical protein